MENRFVKKLCTEGLSWHELAELVGSTELAVDFIDGLVATGIVYSVQIDLDYTTKDGPYPGGQLLVWDGTFDYVDELDIVIYAGRSEPAGGGHSVHRVVMPTDRVLGLEMPEPVEEPPTDKLNVPYLMPCENSFFYMDHRAGLEAIRMHLVKLLGSEVTVWYRTTQETSALRPVVTSFSRGELMRHHTDLFGINVSAPHGASYIYIYPELVIYFEQIDAEDNQRIIIGDEVITIGDLV